MLPSREVARDAGAQNSLAFELCRRDPGGSAGNDMLGDCNGIGVVLLIREADDGQWAIVDDTPDPPMQTMESPRQVPWP